MSNLAFLQSSRKRKHEWLLALRNIAIGAMAILVFALNAWWVTLATNFRDFGSFIAAAQQWASGLSPYSAEHPLVFFVHFEKLGLSAYAVNLNPPLSVLLFAPLAHADPTSAFAMWRLASLVLYALSVVLLATRYRERLNGYTALWVLCLAGFWQTVELGQIYTPLLLAATAAWLALDAGKPVLAGLFIGAVVAIKPNFAIWPALLLLSPAWTAGVTALLTAVVVSAIPLPIFGWTIYLEWLRASQEFSGIAFLGNSSLAGLFVRFDRLWVGYILGALLVVFLAFFIRRRRLGALETTSLGLVASLLAAPISWVGYTLFLLPIYLSRRWTPLVRFSGLMLTLPFVIALILFEASRLTFVLVGWFYGLAILVLLGALLQEFLSRPAAAAVASKPVPQPELRSGDL